VQWRDGLSDNGILVGRGRANGGQARTCTPWALSRLPSAAKQSLRGLGMGVERCLGIRQPDLGLQPLKRPFPSCGPSPPGEAPDLEDLVQKAPDAPAHATSEAEAPKTATERPVPRNDVVACWGGGGPAQLHRPLLAGTMEEMPSLPLPHLAPCDASQGAVLAASLLGPSPRGSSTPDGAGPP